jgi:hypothetical protein
VDQVLAWADSHHLQTQEWPGQDSGDVIDAPGEKWQNLNAALRIGLRGLPGGSSVLQLLAENRGVRNQSDLPTLTEEKILAWADSHRERTGQWPNQNSGSILEAPGETWTAIELALSRGCRGLSGRSSIAQLLNAERSVRNPKGLPALTIEQILGWADAHHQRTGHWPQAKSLPILEAPGETWRNVDAALRSGNRGLSGSSSLARLLNLNRGVQNRNTLPQLNPTKILQWADAHYERTGKWPRSDSGPIKDAPGETWK